MHVHKMLCPFYTITKMPHVTATVAKIALCWRSNACFSIMPLFTQHKTKWLTAISSHCLIFCQKYLGLRSTVICGKKPTTVTCSEPLKICCHVIVTQQRLTIEQSAHKLQKPASPGRVARLAFSMQKSRNLAFFQMVWREKMLFGMYALVWHVFSLFVLVLTEKK